MNVLLVNPNREQMPWPAVPLGLCMVATGLDKAGHDVQVLDLAFSRDPYRDTLDAVRERSPDAIGITVRNIDNCNFESPVFYLEEIRDTVIRAAREAAPSAHVIIGGSAVNVSPRDCFDYLGADFALVGEGENAMGDLLDGLESGAQRPVQGLLARAAQKQKLLPTVGPRPAPGEPVSGRAVVEDLTAVRSEPWRWVDLKRYAARGAPYSVQTKRGCALKCVYCVYNVIEGRTYRLRKPEDIVDEVEEAVVEHGVSYVDFVDSTFNLPLSHGRALCDELARRALRVELSTMGLNPTGVREEFVRDMRRAGFRTVMCTAESASDVTLKSLQKGYDKRTVIRAAQALRKADLRTFWVFMIGAPGETMSTVRETLEFCEEYVSPSDMVLFSTGIRVYAGTPLEERCKEMGWFEPDDKLFYPSWFLSPELDLEELYHMLTRAAESHPNWMTNAETVVSPGLATIMKSAFRVVGWKGPFWQHLPKLHRIVSHTGSRQRGLAEHVARVSSMVDVPHHR